MGLFGRSKKEKEAEAEYMHKIDVPSCIKEDFELEIDNSFTIVGLGTVATGTVSKGMCRVGEQVYINKVNGDTLESTITQIDIHTKDRKPNNAAYRTEHVGLALRGISKEQLEIGDKLIVKNGNMYAMG